MNKWQSLSSDFEKFMIIMMVLRIMILETLKLYISATVNFQDTFFQSLLLNF